MTEIKKAFVVDGKVFETQKEASDYVRLPKIRASLLKLTSSNVELTNWLIDNQEKVEVAFETGTIRRVTKSEHKKLLKALEYLKETFASDSKLSFLVDNTEAIADSFRWPKVKRMTDEEKRLAAKNTLMALSDNNEELVEWVLNNEEAILAAYAAGIEKREINAKALEGLAAYRAAKAAEKAAAESEAA